MECGGDFVLVLLLAFVTIPVWIGFNQEDKN